MDQEESFNIQYEDSPQNTLFTLNNSKLKKKSKDPTMNAFQTKLITFLQKQEERDSDELFLMSLLPEIKKLSAEKKLDFRMHVLQFLKHEQHIQNYNQINTQYPSPYVQPTHQSTPTFDLSTYPPNIYPSHYRNALQFPSLNSAQSQTSAVSYQNSSEPQQALLYSDVTSIRFPQQTSSAQCSFVNEPHGSTHQQSSS